MSEWKEVAEEGQIIYVNEDYGNVVKLGDQMYLALLPKIIKLGPFTDLEHAKSALMWKTKDLDEVLEKFNDSLPATVLPEIKQEDEM